MTLKLGLPTAASIGRRPWLLALAFYCGWTVIATYPLALAPANHIENWGDPLLNVWIMAWDLHQLGRDPLHLFDAPIFYPAQHTLALSELLLVQALQALPIVALTGNFILAYNLTIMLSFVLCGFGAYLLAREALPHAPSLVAGAAYAYSFYRVGEYSHIQILSAQWIPFAILALTRLWRRESWKNAAFLAVMVILQGLSSFYLGLFLLATLVFVLGFLIVASRRLPSREFLVRLGGATVLTVVVLLPFSLPYFDVAREFHLDRSLDDAIAGGASLGSYLAVPPTSWLYHSSRWPVIQHLVTDETLFPGFVTLGLAAVGLLARGGQRWRGFFLGLALFGLILSLGPHLRPSASTDSGLPLPYALLYSYVPGFHSIRVVGRFGVIATLGLAGLAGLGTAALVSRLAKTWQWRVGLLLAVAIGVETLAIPTRMTPVETPSEVPPVYRWLAQQTDGAPVLELPTIEARWLDQSSELERQGHEEYLSIFHWHPTPSGYSGFVPPRFWSVIREAKDVPSDESLAYLRSLGVTYLLFHADQYPADRWQRIVTGLAAAADVARPLTHFGADWVYELAPARSVSVPPTPRLVLPPAIAPSADYRGFVEWQNPDPVARLDHPGQLTVTATWRGPIVTSSTATVAEPSILAQGDTTVPFDLAAPRQPGRYELTVAAAGVTSVATVDVVDARPPANFDTTSRAMQLRDARVTSPSARPGGTVFVLAHWALRRWTLDNYLVRVEMVDPNGTVVAASTADPFGGELETARWFPGEVVELDQGAIIPTSARPGTYDVRLLVRFADGASWKIVGPDNIETDSVKVGRVTVE